MIRYIGKGITDENGIAKLTEDAEGNPCEGYTGTGAGIVNIFAECRSIQSEIYSLYDVLFKDIGTDVDYAKWNSSSQIDSTIVRDSNCTTLTPLDPTVFGARTVNTNGATVVEFDINVNVSTPFMSLRQGTSSVTNLSTQYLDLSVDEWHHIKIEVDGVNYRAIVDGVAKEWKEMTGVQTYDRFQFSFAQNTGLVIKYKNFIMY